MGWLGSYVPGDKVLLSVVTTNSNGVPTMPDTAPTYQIMRNAAQAVAVTPMPIADRYGFDEAGIYNCLFMVNLMLGSQFVGTDAVYFALYRWTIGGSRFMRHDTFYVTNDSGKEEGNVLSATSFPDRGAIPVLYETEGRSMRVGKNPF